MSETIWMVFGTVLAAVATWLTVRIINRRERCAKWAAVLRIKTIGLFGSACYGTGFYDSMIRGPLPTPATRAAVKWFAYGSMIAFAAFSLGAVVAIVIYLKPTSGRQSS